MSRSFELVGGGTCSLLETDGERVVLVSSLACAPGATIGFRRSALTQPNDPSARDSGIFKVKVRSCRLDTTQNEPAFRIEGRFIDLPRAQRLKLLPRS